MSFQFDARTILELGKELISSDEIALYELIKNSIDAGSPNININFHFYIRRKDFINAIELANDLNTKLTKVTEFLFNKAENNDDEYIISFFDKLYNISERNSYIEELEEANRNLNRIIIEDTGEGMSLEELKEVFLKIGTKSRRHQNEAGESKLGDKGIGRLSTMRLGDILSVKTTKINEENWNLLEIDWSRFNRQDEKLVEDIEISPEIGDKKNNKEFHGTIITIKDLSSDWSEMKLQDIVKENIARFVNPFEPGLANKLLKIRFNGGRVLIPSIPKKLLENAHATCKAQFLVDNKGNISIVGKNDYCIYQKKSSFKLENSEVVSIAGSYLYKPGKRGNAKVSEIIIDVDTLIGLGNFDLEIYWFNRKIVQDFEDLTDSQKESRALISRWSGGPMLYRHNYRVLPFGEEDDDWLELDRAAFGSSGFKLNRQQVIGRVSINTPHNILSEQTNREGLINSEETLALRNVVACIVNSEFRNFINTVEKDERLQNREKIIENNRIIEFEQKLNFGIGELVAVAEGKFESEINVIKNYSQKLREESLKIEKNLTNFEKQTKDDQNKFAYLAGLGLMTEYIFHELQRVVENTLKQISKNENSTSTHGLLGEQLRTLEKRISVFDELSSNKRQVKTKFDLCELIRKVVSFHEKEFERHKIKFNVDLPPKQIIISAVHGMVLQIIENLIANSNYWLKKEKAFNKEFEPSIHISLDYDEKLLLIRDNGPGVDISRKDEIFKAFVTTKPIGMGKGLGLFIARDLAQYHGWKLVMEDREIFKKGRLNGFVLQMS